MGDDEEPRSEEMGLLEALFCQDGEFKKSDADPFACTLRLSVESLELELAVTLPEDYPLQPPRVRVTGDRLSRAGQDALAEGMLSAFQASAEAGTPSITAATEWLQENAARHLDAAPAEAPEPTEEPPEAGPGQEPLGRRARAAARGAAAAAQALRGTSCQLREERGDLFEVGAEWSLCHCVSKDLEMSAGIAVAFKKEFGGVPELQSQGPQVGGVVSLQKKGRFIYYLVTKNKYGGKPNVATLEASLRAMRQHMEKDGVRKLAMPKIGCGLDKLSWGTVVEIIMQVFDDMDVELLVRYI